MTDILAQRIEKARNTMSNLPDWISRNARFVGGENYRDHHTNGRSNGTKLIASTSDLGNNQNQSNRD